MFYTLFYAIFSVHIIGRSPGHQKIDQLIPLRLKDFYIRTHQLAINKLSIACYQDKVKLRMNGKQFSRRISESQEDKMKKLMNFYICRRSILVDRLDRGHSLHPDLFPVDLKLKVNSLNALFPGDFETALSAFCSFPLKTVVTIPESSSFDNQVVKFAEILIFNLVFYRIVTIKGLKKLNNKKVFKLFRRLQN